MPRLAYFACGLGIIFYQTLDAIDGKQARRTGSSSPLGELFDHGCDAVSTIFVTLAVLTSLQVGRLSQHLFGMWPGIFLGLPTDPDVSPPYLFVPAGCRA